LEHEIFSTIREHPAAWRLVRQMVADYSGWHWRFSDNHRLRDTDTVDRLSEVAARTTVVVGERDLPDIHDAARTLVDRLPHARLVVVAGSGHLVNLEDPVACNRILAEHLGSA
jgi:pimeloyl-ACP methyl ester carboxylesterase